jgi:hypothetical protein
MRAVKDQFDQYESERMVLVKAVHHDFINILKFPDEFR